MVVPYKRKWGLQQHNLEACGDVNPCEKVRGVRIHDRRAINIRARSLKVRQQGTIRFASHCRLGKIIANIYK